MDGVASSRLPSAVEGSGLDLGPILPTLHQPIHTEEGCAFFVMNQLAAPPDLLLLSFLTLQRVRRSDQSLNFNILFLLTLSLLLRFAHIGSMFAVSALFAFPFFCHT